VPSCCACLLDRDLVPQGPPGNVHICPATINRTGRQTGSVGVCVLSHKITCSIFKGKMLMTSELTEKSFQAVRCLYCSEPIRLSTRLLELCHADSDGTTAELQGQCQVFILRCEACSKEGRYLKSEIEFFESESPQTADLHRFRSRRSAASYQKAAGL